jgi:hypothetical protein
VLVQGKPVAGEGGIGGAGEPPKPATAVTAWRRVYRWMRSVVTHWAMKKAVRLRVHRTSLAGPTDWLWASVDFDEVGQTWRQGTDRRE